MPSCDISALSNKTLRLVVTFQRRPWLPVLRNNTFIHLLTPLWFLQALPLNCVLAHPAGSALPYSRSWRLPSNIFFSPRMHMSTRSSLHPSNGALKMPKCMWCPSKSSRRHQQHILSFAIAAAPPCREFHHCMKKRSTVCYFALLLLFERGVHCCKEVPVHLCHDSVLKKVHLYLKPDPCQRTEQPILVMWWTIPKPWQILYTA